MFTPLTSIFQQKIQTLRGRDLRSHKRHLPTVLFCLILSIIGLASNLSCKDPSAIRPEDALKYLGTQQTVCGKVASTNYAITSRGQPTFLNLNRKYPKHIFTVVIWKSSRHKFKTAPEKMYKSKRICVTGVISSYRGKAQIEVNDPAQIH